MNLIIYFAWRQFHHPVQFVIVMTWTIDHCTFWKCFHLISPGVHPPCGAYSARGGWGRSRPADPAPGGTGLPAVPEAGASPAQRVWVLLEQGVRHTAAGGPLGWELLRIYVCHVMGDDVALYVVVWYDVTSCYGVSNKGEPGNHNAKYSLFSPTLGLGTTHCS